MAWIAQAYEGDGHVVPDTESGHVLSVDCFCAPIIERVGRGRLVTHRDEAARILASPAPA